MASVKASVKGQSTQAGLLNRTMAPTRANARTVPEKDLTPRRLDRVATPRSKCVVASSGTIRRAGNCNTQISPTTGMSTLSKRVLPSVPNTNFGVSSSRGGISCAQNGNSTLRSNNNSRLTRNMTNGKGGGGGVLSAGTTAASRINQSPANVASSRKLALNQSTTTTKLKTVNNSSTISGPSAIRKARIHNTTALILPGPRTNTLSNLTESLPVRALIEENSDFTRNNKDLALTRKALSSESINLDDSPVWAPSTNCLLGNGSSDSGRNGGKKNGVTCSKSVDSLDTQALRNSGDIEETSAVKEFSAEDSDLCRLEAVILEKERLLHEKDVTLELLKEKLRNRDDDVQKLRDDLEGVHKSFHHLTQAQKDEKTKFENSILGIKQEYEQTIDILKKEMIQVEKENETRRRERSSLESAIAELEHKASLVNAEAAVLTKKLIKAQKDYEEADSKYRDELELTDELRMQIRNREEELQELQLHAEEMERILACEKGSIVNEREEWQQFQADMLMVVKVAEEFRAEAASKVESIQKENYLLREKLEVLESRSETKDASVQVTPPPPRTPFIRSESQGSLYSDNMEAHVPSLNITNNNNELNLPLTKYFESISSEMDCSDKENKHNLYAIANSSTLPATEENILRDTSLPEKRVLRTASNADTRRNCMLPESDKSDPLAALVKITGGSKRNALLKWCQNRTADYPHVDITNFSTSWCDGMALCALMHSFLPNKIPYDSLKSENRENNFKVAVSAAESVGITSNLDINEMIADRPIWEDVMNYVKEIYVRLESSPQ